MTTVNEAEHAHRMTMDSGRTAIALLRAMRNGDGLAAMDLASTLTDEEKSYLVGSALSFCNQALNAIDDVVAYARQHGATELHQTSEDVLNVLALGFIE